MPNIGSSQVFISVAEESADVHAAALVRAARERLPGVTFYGLTGPRLRELGVATVYDFAAHAAMLGGVFGVLGQAWRAVQAVERAWRVCRPDLVVLLDSPELHLGVPELGLVGLAGRARRRGIPVLYYIAPQTWAARPWRKRWIVRDIDRLACILPFEEEHFQCAPRPNRDRKGVISGATAVSAVLDATTHGRHGRGTQSTAAFRATYVGHPLFETLRQERPLPETVEFLKQRAGGRPIVALLPGSRRHVIDAMLPRQLEVVRRLRAAGHDVYAAISCISPDRREQIRALLQRSLVQESQVREPLVREPLVRESLLAPNPAPLVRESLLAPNPAPLVRESFLAPNAAGIPSRAEPDRNPAEPEPEKGFSAQQTADLGIDLVVADNASLLAAADLVLVTSGTATLHAAYYRKPLIVMYDAGRLMSGLHRLFGPFILGTPDLSLVNILARARVVPEFMPSIPDLGAVAAVAGQLLTDTTWRDLMIRQIDAIVQPLESSAASDNVCRLISEMLAAGDRYPRRVPLTEKASCPLGMTRPRSAVVVHDTTMSPERASESSRG